MNRPDIQSVTITPKATTAKAQIKIAVQVTDKAITFTKVAEYAKEIYAGQQIGVL